MKRSERTNAGRLGGGESAMTTPSLFQFSLVDRLQCQQSKTVKYTTQAKDNMLSLQVGWTGYLDLSVISPSYDLSAPHMTIPYNPAIDRPMDAATTCRYPCYDHAYQFMRCFMDPVHGVVFMDSYSHTSIPQFMEAYRYPAIQWNHSTFPFVVQTVMQYGQQVSRSSNFTFKAH